MNKLIFFHTYNYAECVRRVSELVARNYRVDRLVVTTRADGGVICRVKARRSVLAYVAHMLRHVDPSPRLLLAT